MCFWLVYQPSDFSHMDFLENGLRFIRRGRASRPKRDLDGDEPSDYEELSSEVEMDDMKEWLCITASKNQLLPHQILVKKFTPGNSHGSLRAVQSNSVHVGFSLCLVAGLWVLTTFYSSMG